MGKFKSGFVAIIGRPNTGKSTLINYLASQKVAIVSDKPQTTRHSIRAVINLPNSNFKLTNEALGEGGAQVIFIDTPGFHKPKHVLGERLNQRVLSAINEVDAIIFLLDGFDGIGRGDQFLASYFNNLKVPVIAVINKLDVLSKARMREQIEAANELFTFHDIIPISALSGKNVDELLKVISVQMPEGPQYYPAEMLSDQPESVLIAELIREKILIYMRDEVPHSVYVEVENMSSRPNKDILDVNCVIFTERESQKGIIIGKKGETIKKILTEARTEIEALLGSRIFLETRVKVRKKWRTDESFLQRMNS